jgi:hypothetical protein
MQIGCDQEPAIHSQSTRNFRQNLRTPHRDQLPSLPSHVAVKLIRSNPFVFVAIWYSPGGMQHRRAMILSIVMLILSVFFIYLCNVASAVKDRHAIFLLGDSTSERVYRALRSFCNGVKDPRAILVFEHNGCTKPNESSNATESCTKQDLPYLCGNDSQLSRIGYTIHWGVSPIRPYHHAVGCHRTAADNATSSVENILLAVGEFQRRAENEATTFILVSNAWDTKRYEDYFYDAWTLPQFGHDYETNLRSLITLIKSKLRPSDRLLLSTTHLPIPKLSTLFHVLNERIRAVAKDLGITLFDSSLVVGEENPSSYLEDHIHQNPEASLKIATAIMALQ